MLDTQLCMHKKSLKGTLYIGPTQHVFMELLAEKEEVCKINQRHDYSLYRHRGARIESQAAQLQMQPLPLSSPSLCLRAEALELQ